jgi:hypothetical protein
MGNTLLLTGPYDQQVMVRDISNAVYQLTDVTSKEQFIHVIEDLTEIFQKYPDTNEYPGAQKYFCERDIIPLLASMFDVLVLSDMSVMRAFLVMFTELIKSEDAPLLITKSTIPKNFRLCVEKFTDDDLLYDVAIWIILGKDVTPQNVESDVAAQYAKVAMFAATKHTKMIQGTLEYLEAYVTYHSQEDNYLSITQFLCEIVPTIYDDHEKVMLLFSLLAKMTKNDISLITVDHCLSVTKELFLLLENTQIQIETYQAVLIDWLASTKIPEDHIIDVVFNYKIQSGICRMFDFVGDSERKFIRLAEVFLFIVKDIRTRDYCMEGKIYIQRALDEACQRITMSKEGQLLFSAMNRVVLRW